MTTDPTHDHDLARAPAHDLVAWQPIEHASGRRGRRYTFAGPRPARLAAPDVETAIRILMAG